MNIIICDDNPVHAKEMEEIVEKYQEQNIGHREVYTNMEVLHAQIGEHLQGDVYLMDIEWGNTPELINGGIQLAETIYNMNPRARIIYTTAHMGAHVQEFYLHRANIAGLINKPVDPVVLYQHLDRIKEEMRKDDYAYWTVSYRSTSVPDLLVMHSHGKKFLKFIEEFKNWRVMWEDVVAYIEKQE